MAMTNKMQRGLTVESGRFAPSSSMFLKIWLDHDLSMARAVGRSLAVFVVRIDRYRDLEQRYGGPELEAAMASLGSNLKSLLQPADSLVRSADDGFTVIHSFTGDPTGLHGLAKTMLQQLQQPVRLDADERRLAASIGIAFYPDDGQGAACLLDRAHDALQRTDRWGGDGFCFHSRSTAKKVAGHLLRQEDFRRALDAGDLAMRFQPILDLSRNGMAAVSGDVHWQHPVHGSMEMADILPMVEQGGLMRAFNSWLVDDVCRQLTEWQRAGIERSISIGVMRAQLADSHLARLLSTRFSAPAMRADMLELCVDHDVLLAETDHRVRTGLQQIADLGIAFHLSNVGRGPLAIQALQNLPIRSVGLAPELIATIGRCPSAETMLDAVIGLVHRLGLSIRAVDVSSQEQLDFLKDLGCDEAMGLFFAPALRSFDIDRLTGFASGIGSQDKFALSPHEILMH